LSSYLFIRRQWEYVRMSYGSGFLSCVHLIDDMNVPPVQLWLSQWETQTHLGVVYAPGSSGRTNLPSCRLAYRRLTLVNDSCDGDFLHSRTNVITECFSKKISPRKKRLWAAAWWWYEQCSWWIHFFLEQLCDILFSTGLFPCFELWPYSVGWNHWIWHGDL